MAISEKIISDKLEQISTKEQINREIASNPEIVSFAAEKIYSHSNDLEKLLNLAQELKNNIDGYNQKIKVLNISFGWRGQLSVLFLF